jgi:hypothetical protein
MTVCIAALALNRTRIVGISDRQRTGEYKIEENTTKSFWLPNGWVAMYSGSPTFALSALQRAHRGLLQARLGVQGDWNRVDVPRTVHAALLDQWRDGVQSEVLAPRFLDIDSYRTKDDKTRAEAETAIAWYRDNVACDLLVCGFQPENHGNLLVITLDGWQSENHFASIGSGSRVAESRLTWQKTDSQDQLGRVLYEVYTAKAHAEMDAFVGKQIDGWVLMKNYGWPDQSDMPNAMRLISDDTLTLLDGVFRYYDQTPFQSARRPTEDVPPAPPKNWEWQLDEKLQGVLPPQLPAPLGDAATSSSATVPPSSQSQSGGQR